jgi:hypothetical protein
MSEMMAVQMIGGLLGLEGIFLKKIWALEIITWMLFDMIVLHFDGIE